MSKEEKLHLAISEGQLDAVEKALTPTLLTLKKVDVNAVVDGWTPLQRAAFEGHKEIVRLLIAKGAVLDTIHDNRHSALYQASLMGHKEIVALLVAQGADLTPTPDGWTPLLHASSEGDTQLVDLLIENGADVNTKNASGWTALLYAACAGSTETAKLLLDRGADVDVAADGGQTALLCAAGDGFAEVVELLVEAGADVNAATNQGTTPLIVASRRGRTSTVERLLAAGADPNASTEEGWTALHHASKAGHIGIVESLIENGADSDKLSHDGWTARRLAELAHHNQIAELLPPDEAAPATSAVQDHTSASRQGNNLEGLFHNLRIPNPATQMEAVDGLVAAGPEVVPTLIRDLEDTYLTAGHRKAAAVALGRIGDHRADEPLMRIVNGYWSGTPEEREAARKHQSLIPDEHLEFAQRAKEALVALGHDLS